MLPLGGNIGMPGMGMPGMGGGMPGMPGVGMGSFPGLGILRPQMGMGMGMGMGAQTRPQMGMGMGNVSLLQGLQGNPLLRPTGPLNAGMLRPAMQMSKASLAVPPTQMPAALSGMQMSKASAMTPATGSLPKAPGPVGPLASQPAVPCTVYVGRISAEVPDDVVRQLLEKCGKVAKWNRAADPNTSKLTSFGFCDFEEPQGLWRALNFLHEKQLCDKRLLVKCEEKVMHSIVQWKSEKKAEIEKARAEKKDEKGEAKKDEIEIDSELPKGPLTETQLDDELQKENKAIADDITKLLQAKSKGYPEVKADGAVDDVEEKGTKDAIEKPEGDKEKEKDAGKDDGKKDDEKDKGKSKEEEKKLSKSEERRRDEKKNAVSRHYRQSRRERDREDRLKGRDKEVEKEYQYRVKEFERGEEPRLKKLKRDLRDFEMAPDMDERSKRKLVERDLNFGKDSYDERDWKRYRDDRQKERDREREKDAVDRAAEQADVDEKKQKKDEDERRKRKEREAEEAKKKKQEDDERRRKEEEEQRKRDAELKAKQEEEEREREIERKKLMAEEEKVQEAAATKLFAQVQEEMRQHISGVSMQVEGKTTNSAGANAVQSLFNDGREDEGKKHRPLTRLDDNTGGGETKLKEEDMRKLIQQVPTDKAKAFAYPIDWDIVHSHNIIEKKLRPWVKKKVAEYLGQEELGMIEFIMRKVAAHSVPDTILAELEGFLDEEAENFTLKMWRMLIFEVLRVSIANAAAKR